MNTKNIAPFTARQGDVLIERINALPVADIKPVDRENGRIILAHGEATGHAHAIAERGTLHRQNETVSYLEIQEALALLQHDEHATIELPAGVYRITRQREYSPEAIRNVAD